MAFKKCLEKPKLLIHEAFYAACASLQAGMPALPGKMVFIINELFQMKKAAFFTPLFFMLHIENYLIGEED